MSKKNNNISDVERLKSNAVFQLSLSSKELFHINFLYWMAIDTKLPDTFFPNLMEEAFGFNLLKNDQNWRKNYLFFREYENFDFCIRERLSKASKIKDENSNPDSEEKQEEEKQEEEKQTEEKFVCSQDVPKEQWGRIVFVLENKFKSLPREDQLIEYIQKVVNINSPIDKARTLNSMRKRKEEFIRLAKSTGNSIFEEYYDYIKNFIKTIRKEKPFIGPQPKLVLLTLAKPNFGDTRLYSVKFNGSSKSVLWNWDIIRYSDYADSLKRAIPSSSPVVDDNFRQLLLTHYIDFISLYSVSVDNALKGIEEGTSFLKAFKANPFSSLRVDDIWQKLVADKIDSMIAKELHNRQNSLNIIHAGLWDQQQKDKYIYQVGEIVHGADYTRSSGVFTVRIMLQDGYSFNIQVQNGQYRRCLEYWGHKKGDKNTYKDVALEFDILNPPHQLSFLKKYIRFDDDVSSSFKYPSFTKDSQPPLPIKKVGIPANTKIYEATPEQRGFCKFGYIFIYQYWQIDDMVTIDQIIDAICNDIISVYKDSINKDRLLKWITKTP